MRIDFLNDSACAVFGEDVGALEQNPKKLIDFFDKILLQHFESGAISYRLDDSVRSESAPGERLLRDDDAGARRLAALVGELRSDQGLRLERLRFGFVGAAQTLSFLCRSLETESGVSFVIAALGVRADSPAQELRGAAEPPAEAVGASNSEGSAFSASGDNVVALRAPSSPRVASDALESLSSSERLAFDEIARTLKEGGIIASDAAATLESKQDTPETHQPTTPPRNRELLAPGPEQSALALARALEERLARAKSDNALLGAAFDLSGAPLAIMTAEGMIVRANARFAACFGADARDCENRSLASLLSPSDAQSLAQRMSVVLDHAAFERNRPSADDEKPDSAFSQRALSGARARLSLSRAPPGGAPVDLALRPLAVEGKPTFLVSVEAQEGASSSDPAVEAARLAAESANAAKSDFLTRVSHEIRTPLNAIIGFAEVMMEERLGPLGSPRYKEYLKDMHASGAHVLSLVNDLLDLSKIEAGMMELSFARVDANAVIAECASMMQAQANQARVVLRLALAPSLPPLRADPRSLKQILLNLLSNAVKFNEPGGQVIVSSALNDAGAVVIRVKDTGIGMSEEDVATALEPFRRVDTARKASGTGLGLPLTKALIEANHASFSVKSSRNEGTLIEIAFTPPRVIAAE
ncbi:MAG: PAS domain-containing protein [Methylocystis sp.]|nr:PAS domain-containing protein [Methylocystis sp.]